MENASKKLKGSAEKWRENKRKALVAQMFTAGAGRAMPLIETRLLFWFLLHH